MYLFGLVQNTEQDMAKTQARWRSSPTIRAYSHSRQMAEWSIVAHKDAE
jgi:hypothetical protein